MCSLLAFLYAGRMMRLLPISSNRWAVQPAMRAQANRGVNRFYGTPIIRYTKPVYISMLAQMSL